MGVTPDCERLILSTMKTEARIIFSGPTGNQPSQYAQAVKPLTCSAKRGQRVLNAGYAYDGEPPVRSGIIAESSARNRHRSQPLNVTMTMLGIDAAPTDVTITGAMPVTRIVPASPMTNAPHQLVSRGSPPPS